MTHDIGKVVYDALHVRYISSFEMPTHAEQPSDKALVKTPYIFLKLIDDDS